eukprot:TRINITY_DN8238_c0_g2_i2.p1 TRINITY_DN8238_c0_g2~~TRINITY_DN8238_c0_g2_i2.p1  ORF type:complete len:575 (-),score=118.46 TRINITY_DN8238_c0_g2_i2:175-1899(-)
MAEKSKQKLMAELFENDFQHQLEDNPEFATQAGFHSHGARLQKIGPQAFEDRLEHNNSVLEEVRKMLEDTAGLSEKDILYAKLFASAVEGENRGIQCGCHLMPLNCVGAGGGVHENFLELLEWMPLESAEDMSSYIQRLVAFQEQVDDFCGLLAYGAGMRGIVCSKSMLRRVPDRLKELLAGDFAELREPVKGKDFLNAELEKGLDDAITHCFRPGLQKLLDFIEDFYGDRLRDDPGCSAVRGGTEIYAECLRFHTTTTKTAQEVHDLGLQEVKRIEARMKSEVLEKLGFEGSLTEFAESLKKDPNNFYSTEEECLEGYRALVAEISEVLPRFFSKLPESKLDVVAKRAGPAAYYFAGTPDGKRPGRFYVNVSRLSERPKYNMAALALHEGVPGHHLQGSIALENEDLPSFLRYIEDRRYEFNAARRPLYTGYLEGWALYSERLGEEMGMYKTPLELFGRLSLEMWRAVRLVVDTGIHAFGWSIEKASMFLQEKTGLPESDCIEECHRYAAWPGQACAYKVGQLAIEEIRSRAEKTLGDDFDIKAFHELLVGFGPMPLDVLADQAEVWINERKR